MEHKIEVRQMFDESFKRMVIEEYLSAKCSKMELLRKYNIHFQSRYVQSPETETLRRKRLCGRGHELLATKIRGKWTSQTRQMWVH